MENATDTLSSEMLTEEFRKRIRRNIDKSLNEKFSSQVLEHLPGLLIKVKLERAVFEYALLFRRYVEQQLSSNYKNYILDLSDTLFLDSTFLGSIILLLKKIEKMDGTLRIVVNSKKIMLISQINNIGDIIDTFSTVDEAIVNL